MSHREPLTRKPAASSVNRRNFLGSVAAGSLVCAAALVLWAAGRAGSPAEGCERARQAMADGAAWSKLEQLREALAADGIVDLYPAIDRD